MQGSRIDQPLTGAPRWRLVGIVLALAAYVLAFSLFYPSVLTVSDEAAYVEQASAFASGRTTVSMFDAATMRDVPVLPSSYPPGTSLFLAPFMACFGWRGAFLLGLLSVCFTVLLTAHWLVREGRDPRFALLFLTYPAVLVMSRCGMSDVPSAALVTLGLYLFWFADGRRGWFATAGFVAGVSILLRETNAMVFAFFFLSALLRRQTGSGFLILGGLAGSGLRLIMAGLLTGDPFFFRPDYPGFSLVAVGHNAIFHLGALMVLFPGGLVWIACYRGRHRAEVAITVAAFVSLFLLYDYNAANSGGLKQWILTSRFFIPLLPVLIVATTEALPRLLRGALSRAAVLAPNASGHQTSIAGAAFVLIACTGSFVAHWQHWVWSTHQKAVLTSLLASTTPNTPVFTNLDATRKFFNQTYAGSDGVRRVISLDVLTDSTMDRLLSRFGVVQIAIVTRSDSPYWARSSEGRLNQVEDLTKRFSVELHFHLPLPSGETVSVWSVRQRH